MESFRDLWDAGWGARHFDPVTGACPGCGANELVFVEDAQHELKLFCEACDRCWSVDRDRLRHVDPVWCPGCWQQARCFDRLRHDFSIFGPWNPDADAR